jgi:2-polyprenyl-3-methyl-5-hydroxy-6-metoxy-1,4-benzoquinol methylase
MVPAVGVSPAGVDTLTRDLSPDVVETHTAWLSKYARAKKLEYFFSRVPADARILDVGCADGWVGRWANDRGWTDVTGIDLRPPADIVGDVTRWWELGLDPESFDCIVAFEVLEHADLAAAMRALLKPDGILMATTPVPRFDWACKCLEAARVLQKRTGEHVNLVDLREYPGFRAVDWRVKGLISQWGILIPA